MILMFAADDSCLLVQCAQQQASPFPEAVENFFIRTQHRHLLWNDVALFHPPLHALFKFSGHTFRPFHQPGRLIQKNKRLILRKIIQKRHSVLIKIADKTVHIGAPEGKLKSLRRLLINPLQPGSLLRFSRFAKNF